MFRIASRTKVNGLIDVVKYASERSGLSVVIADVEGPMVGGHLCLATETNTEEGLPHTLEHLVFLGSRNYPYNGLLDTMANRCLASGTNAWTGQDHTCYTLQTVGLDGFLKMLPVFMDHLLQPLLKDCSFLTEVHHINGEGEDAGVVYSEMQDYESKLDQLTEWKLKELMYPEDCGYRVETGGRLKSIRNSCSNAKVRHFHKQFYHPHNLTIIVTGMVDHKKILDVVSPVEEEVLMISGLNDSFKKPFSPEIKTLTESCEAEVKCPADDVTRGSVIVGLFGPKGSEMYKQLALQMFVEYLTDTAVSPLQRDFVQIADPFCSSVSNEFLEQSRCVVVLSFHGVPTTKLNDIKPKLLKTIEKIVSGDEVIDMDRMTALIRQNILRIQNALETAPHDLLATMVIGDQLYGDTSNDFEARMNDVAMLKKLRQEEPEFWLNISKEYFDLKIPYVIGRPDADYVNQLTAEENERIRLQRVKLGEDGLKACQTQLDEAVHDKESNQPDDSLLKDCIVNSLDGVHFFSLNSSANLVQVQDTNPKFRLSKLPFKAMLDDCKTNFVQLTAVLDTTNLPKELRPYLLLWTNLIFESPLRLKDGSIMSYEQVVKDMNKDLVDYNAGLGIGSSCGSTGQYQRIMELSVKVDQEDYEKGVSWLKKLLFDVSFAEERVRVVAQKLINSAAAAKQEGHAVSKFLLAHIMYENGSNTQVHSVLRQEKFLQRLLLELDNQPECVISEFDRLRSNLVSSGNVSIHLMCNCERLVEIHGSQLESVWSNTFETENIEQPLPNKCLKIDSTREPLFLKADNCGVGALIPLGASESTYIYQVIPAIRSYDNCDLPILMLFIQYVDQCEGPLFRDIRGKGLAYGANIYINVDAGLIYLRLYRCSQPVQAYQQTKNIVSRILDGVDEINQDEFDGAKRSLISDIISREETVSAASDQSLLSYYRNVSHKFNRELCDKVWNVSVDDLLPVAKKYLPSLFDFSVASTAITCHPSKVDEIISGFSKMNKTLKVMAIEDPELYI